MKKITLLLFLFVATSAINHSQALPNWVKQMFGCTWTWISQPQPVEILPNGLCRFEQAMYGSSWLWGDCGVDVRSYTSSCELPYAGRPPLPEGPDFQLIANEMGNLYSLGFTGVDSNWINPTFLENNPSELLEAIEYRLELAGYDYDPNWLNLIYEPCPVPAPTITIQLPQEYEYLIICPIVVYPNPTQGIFTIDLDANYQNTTKIEVVQNTTGTIVYTKDQNIISSEIIDITNELSGNYTIRVYTTAGMITEIIVKLPDSSN